MRRIPALDMHAHLATNLSARDIAGLGALVWAATRSLDEFEETLGRADDWVVWGVGCHPGLVGVQKTFDVARFEKLIESTPLVSEVGLDGKARPAMELQRRKFRDILRVLAETPRVTSIHSYAAIPALLEELEAQPIRGAVLHWWLGDPGQTANAIDLGCYFSVNAASVRHVRELSVIPLDRLLPETDHPFGDRFDGPHHRPGNVDSLEDALGRLYGLAQDELRLQIWRNLRSLLSDTSAMSFLSRPARVLMLSL
jgi:TatD DNase family protein